MSACIKEMEMEREVDRISVVMEGKQIKSMSEVKAIELIGRIIVMGRIKTEIADRNIWIEIPEFF